MTSCLLSSFIVLKPLLSTLPPLSGGPWEMEKNLIEEVGQDMSIISTNYTLPVSSFVSAGTTGIYAGVTSGTNGRWTVQGGPQTIGGTLYTGGGLLVVTNLNQGETVDVESGARLQLGEDVNALTGSIFRLNVAAGAVAEIVGANTTLIQKTRTLTNDGIVNIRGPGVCGQGFLGTNGVVNNRSVINIEDASWTPIGQNMTSDTHGEVNVADGATLRLTHMIIRNTVNINGDGWCDANNVQIGAIHLATGTTIAANVNVQTAASIGTNSTATVTLSGLLTGAGPLRLFSTLGAPSGTFTWTGAVAGAGVYDNTITIDGTRVTNPVGLTQAHIHLTNKGLLTITAARSIRSISADDPGTVLNVGSQLTVLNNGATSFAGKFLQTNIATFSGPATNEITLLPTSVGNTARLDMQGGSRLVLDGATFTTNGPIIRSGSAVSTIGTATPSLRTLTVDAGGIIETRNDGTGAATSLHVVTFTSSAPNLIIDLPDAIAPGSYTILTAGAGTGVGKPVVAGVNNTGLTPTFTWDLTVTPRTLTLTL